MQSLSLKLGHWVFAGIINVLVVITLLFCTVNRLTSVPLDKVFICVCMLVIVLMNPDRTLFTAKEFLAVVLFIAVPVLSSVMNLVFVPIIFFPVIGFCFAVILSRYKATVVYALYYALFMHIVTGLIILALAVLGLTDLHVSEGMKGFDLYATHGFTSTVQTYGTLCITWLLLYLLRRKLGLNTAIDKVFLVITNIAILLTFNRSTYLFWVIVLFLEFSAIFWSMAVIMGAVLIKFWDIITAFILSSSTITSRFELLKGFEISYIQSNSPIVYLFGRGTNQISQEVAKRVRWTKRIDLENGYTMLLHSYGLIGLSVYLFVCFYFIFMFLKKNRFKEAFFLAFYFFITQYITQEFVSTTFYMFLVVMLVTYDHDRDPAKFRISNS